MSCVGDKTVSTGDAKNVHLSGMSISLEASRSVATDVPNTSVAIDMKEPMVLVSERVAPDGGYGWLVSAMTFVVTFLLTGFLKSFSVWRAFVVAEFPDTTTTDAAWISGCIGTLSLMTSPLTSGLLARYGNGPVVSAGCIICALGFSISCFATSAVYLIGSLGVCVGVGSSFMITASVGCTGKFFTTRKPMAMTIALSGGCLGAIIMPYILRPLFNAAGMHYGFLALAGIFALLSLSGLIYANPESHFPLEEKEVPAEEGKDATNPAAEKTLREKVRTAVMELMALRYLRHPLFLTMAFSVFAVSMGSPHFLGQISGQAKRLGASADKISLLTLLVQLADLLARLVYGMLASKSPLRRTSEYT
ncbi:MFS transporter, partial [Flavobacterium sp.]